MGPVEVTAYQALARAVLRSGAKEVQRLSAPRPLKFKKPDLEIPDNWRRVQLREWADAELHRRVRHPKRKMRVFKLKKPKPTWRREQLAAWADAEVLRWRKLAAERDALKPPTIWHDWIERG